jgi:hypothetical protein
MAMYKTVVLAFAIVAASHAASAQQNVRILTPSLDTCSAFTKAMDAKDEARLAGLTGWTLGYLSGVAQGSGVDFLRNAEASKLFTRLYAGCSTQPSKSLSLAVEEMAREFLASRKL